MSDARRTTGKSIGIGWRYETENDAKACPWDECPAFEKRAGGEPENNSPVLFFEKASTEALTMRVTMRIMRYMDSKAMNEYHDGLEEK